MEIPPSPSWKSDWRCFITKSLWSSEMRRPTHFTDLEFRCSDGSIKCHTSYLKTMCPFIKYVLAATNTKEVKENVMIIPDYKISIVTSFLEMIYTGNTWVERYDDFEEIKQFGFKLLGFFIGLNMNVKLEGKRTSNRRTRIFQKEPVNKDLATSCNLSPNNEKFECGQNKTLLENDELFSETDNPSKSNRYSDITQYTVSDDITKDFLQKASSNVSTYNSNQNEALLENDNPSKRCKPMQSTSSSYSNSIQNTVSDNITRELSFSEEEMSNDDNFQTIDCNETVEDSFPEHSMQVNNNFGDALSERVEQIYSISKNKVSMQRSGKRKWECKICLETFRVEPKLVRHSWDYHNEKYPFACSLCPKKYTSQGHLSSHCKVIHLKKLDHVCEVCGKRFAFRSQLNKHMKILRGCTRNQTLYPIHTIKN